MTAHLNFVRSSRNAMKEDSLCKYVMDLVIRGQCHLDQLQSSVLYFLVWVIEMEVEEVKDLSLVHLAPADLVVLQLVSVTTLLKGFEFVLVVSLRITYFEF